MPRFAILEHDWPTRHWDLLLEDGEHLRAWRLLEPPENEGPIAAVANFDHRKRYLDYEGPLSGSRGSVTQWEAGTFEWIRRSEHEIVIQLNGRRLTGRFELTALSEGKTWIWQREGH